MGIKNSSEWIWSAGIFGQREAQNPSYLLWCVQHLFKLVFPYQQEICAKASSKVKKKLALLRETLMPFLGGLMDGEEGADGIPLFGMKSID